MVSHALADPCISDKGHHKIYIRVIDTGPVSYFFKF